MYADEFRRGWYTLNSSGRAFILRFNPGVAEAIRNNDWVSADQLAGQQWAAEKAYEKHYHRPSPAFIAAYQAAYGQRVTATTRRK